MTRFIYSQYDVDQDGMLDIVFATSSGDLMFYSPNGTAIRDKFLEVIDCNRQWGLLIRAQASCEI